MKNTYITFVLTSIIAVGSLALSIGVAFADGEDFGYSWGDTGSDYGYSWGDTGSDYGYSWGDTGSDYGYSWGDTGSDYGYSWGDTGSDYGYSWGDTGSDYGYSWGETGNGTEYTAYPYSGTEYTAYPGTEYTAYPYSGTEYTAYPGGGSYSTPSCTSCGGYGGYGGGSSYGGSSGYGRMSVSSGIPSWIGWSGSSYVPPKTPTYPTTPTRPVTVGGGSVTNTNITNIDNSIRDSFNNYNSGNTTIVTQAQPQMPIVYTPPVQNLYCTIYATPQTIQNGSTATLSWTSYGASSAWLSDGIGSVLANSSLVVRPETSRTYTLTVYGAGGTQTCSTYVNVSGAYVALTQIPYTGFDLGPIGNAMYWVGMLSFAAAGAYLMVYYKGGALAFAGVALRARRYQPVVAPKAPILIEREAQTAKLAPIVKALSANPTSDTMAIVQKEGSMPKIIIDRS